MLLVTSIHLMARDKMCHDMKKEHKQEARLGLVSRLQRAIELLISSSFV